MRGGGGEVMGVRGMRCQSPALIKGMAGADVHVGRSAVGHTSCRNLPYYPRYL